jgi:DNA-binding LacI/PurR family transcriptional regulator
VGLVFPGHPETLRSYYWTRFYAAVWASADQLSRRSAWEIVPYFDIEPGPGRESTAGYNRLMEDVRSDRLAGLVFSYAPYRLGGTELLRERPVPMVRVAGRESSWGPAIGVDREAVLERVVSHLAGRNRRRLAWMMIVNQDPYWLREKLQGLHDRYDFRAPARWIYPIHPADPQWIRHAIEMILSGPAAERPDGLVLLDDHLVEPALDALEDFSVRLPDDLAVVGYWNFPLGLEPDRPVTRLGLDTREQLRIALQLLREETGEGANPERRETRPIFASEFEQRYSPHAYVSLDETWEPESGESVTSPSLRKNATAHI